MNLESIERLVTLVRAASALLRRSSWAVGSGFLAGALVAKQSESTWAIGVGVGLVTAVLLRPLDIVWNWRCNKLIVWTEGQMRLDAQRQNLRAWGEWLDGLKDLTSEKCAAAYAFHGQPWVTSRDQVAMTWLLERFRTPLPQPILDASCSSGHFEATWTPPKG
jgi:hypothetical protein